ncbi:hypothetical protein ABQF26_38230, partial [Mycolicibacterium elephantis]
LSVRTVDKHVATILDKLQAPTGAMRCAGHARWEFWTHPGDGPTRRPSVSVRKLALERGVSPSDTHARAKRGGAANSWVSPASPSG